MNVTIISEGREFELEGSNMEPPTPGQFLKGVLGRREITTPEFSKASGLNLDDVAGILEDRMPLERPVTKKIDQALPGVSKLMVRLGRHREFYDRYGCIRPSSPIRRALVIARCKLELT